MRLSVNRTVRIGATGWSGMHLIGGNGATLLHFVDER